MEFFSLFESKKIVMDDRIGISKYPCKYPNCSSKYYNPIFKEDYYNKRFYRFPKNGAVSLQWKDICKIDHSIMTDNFFVCEDHFAPKDFMNHTKNRLVVGAIPARLSQPCDISDHDYVRETGDKKRTLVQLETDDVSTPECATTLHDKYVFLSDNSVELPVRSSSSVASLKLRKLTMLKIHQAITVSLLKLRNIFHKEKTLLHKLLWLYKGGRFDNINRQLEYVSNEFLQYQLEITPLNVKKWTAEDHFLALSLYNRNEKLYKYLCYFFHLPPVKKLKHMLSSISFKTGINNQLIEQLKLDVGKLNVGNQTCVLLMDEMMLTCGVSYDEPSQHLCGYEDLGDLGRSARPADRVLVLMARGLRKNWTQVVSYYFSCGPFKDTNLQNIIVTTVKYLQSVGLSVGSFVCQRNDTNLNALALLTARTERSSYFIVNLKHICINFDVRHLLKETRNALIKCQILYDEDMGKIAKLEHIESAYNIDQSKRIFKHLSMLEDQYFQEKDSSNEADIAAASAILSHTVAATIETFITCGELPQEAMNTAEFVEIMDMLFDSLNGSQKNPLHKKKYRCALSLNSPHLKFWSSLLPQFEKWKLIDLSSAQDVTSQYPFIKGWQTTIESLFYLWSHLKHLGYFNYLSLDRFNLEPLEKLFKGISEYGTNGENPTCHQFVAALKGEILNGSQNHLITDNYCNLTSLSAFIENILSENSSSWQNVSEIYFDDLEFDSMSDIGFHEEAAYLSGYLLQKVEVPDCETCRSHLLAEWVINNTEVVSYKKYSDDSTYSLYASDSVIRIVDRLLYLLYLFLRDQSNQSNLEDSFKAQHKREFESFKFCSIHSYSEDFVSLCVKLGIHRFIYSFNKAINL